MQEDAIVLNKLATTKFCVVELVFLALLKAAVPWLWHPVASQKGVAGIVHWKQQELVSCCAAPNGRVFGVGCWQVLLGECLLRYFFLSIGFALGFLGQ